MIEARGLVKRYGSTAAVNDLDYPSAGTVTVNGKPYAQLPFTRN